jgi:hypothetical protein
MRRTLSPTRLAVIALGCALALGGCGDDDDGSSSATSAVVDDECATGSQGGMGESEAPDPTVPEPPIDGVEVYTDLTHNHVEGCVEYAQTPPVGGDHWGVWQSCGFYDAPVRSERAVHSMEHGAVWITYMPDVDAAGRARLEDLAGEFVLVSEWAGDPLPAPVVASAWGLQLLADGPDDPRLTEFAATYANGPQNREPGAPCVEGGTTDLA